MEIKIQDDGVRKLEEQTVTVIESKPVPVFTGNSKMLDVQIDTLQKKIDELTALRAKVQSELNKLPERAVKVTPKVSPKVAEPTA